MKVSITSHAMLYVISLRGLFARSGGQAERPPSLIRMNEKNDICLNTSILFEYRPKKKTRKAFLGYASLFVQSRCFETTVTILIA